MTVPCLKIWDSRSSAKSRCNWLRLCYTGAMWAQAGAGDRRGTSTAWYGLSEPPTRSWGRARISSGPLPKMVVSTSKTKELSAVFRKHQPSKPSVISGEPVQSVTGCKHHSTELNHKLKGDWLCKHWGTTKNVSLKKLLGVFLFNSAFTESVLTFCIMCWFGMLLSAEEDCWENGNHSQETVGS